jgi:DNA mismatch repair protein MLH1
MGISVPASATTIDRIRHIHNSSVANELIRIESSNDRWAFKAEGWMSNANYSVKKTTFLLFINHRSVESTAIKKAIEQTYSTFLPKGGHPFIYLSLEIEPDRVDVNVHPTKREVNFLHQDEIIEVICDDVRAALGNVDASRTFMTQTLLPNANIQLSKPGTPTPFTPYLSSTPRSDGATGPRASTARKIPRPYDNGLVRTDAKARKITSMLPPGAPSASDDAVLDQVGDMQYETTGKERILWNLYSIKELRAEVRDNMHNELTDVFASHTFVGIVDMRKRIVAIQSGVKLYLVDYGMLCNEYFYQLGLTDFGNFGTILLDSPLDLGELLEVGANQEQERRQTSPNMVQPVDWDEVVDMVRSQLISRRKMLEDCFSISITEDGLLTGLPLLMKGYIPSMAKLPNFLLRLGPFVNWDEEKPCFHSFLRELSSFYVPEALPPVPTRQSTSEGGDAGVEVAGRSVEHDEDPEIAVRRKHLARSIENVLFPAFKSRLVATKGLLKGIVEIANLRGLYRVFERC